MLKLVANIKTLLIEGNCTNELLLQGYRKAKVVSTVKKIYGRHHDLADPYYVAFSKLISDLIASVEALSALISKLVPLTPEIVRFIGL